MSDPKISLEPPPEMPMLRDWLRMSAAEHRAIAKEFVEWLERGGHRTNVTAESVKQFLAERERQNEHARQHQANRTPESREYELNRIAADVMRGVTDGNTWDGKHWRDRDGNILRSHRGLPAPTPGFDPKRYDPAHPIYNYDPQHYDAADYEAWKQSRIAYQLKKNPNTAPDPFGPDGATSVRGKADTKNNLVKVAYRNIVQFFQPGNDDGIAAVEFAMVAPVLILLMAVSFTIASMQMAKQAVMFATQQAAVVQSTGGTPATIFAANVAHTPAGNGTVTCNTSGNVATCTGTVQFANAFAGVLGTGPTTPLTYSASVQVPPS